VTLLDHATEFGASQKASRKPEAEETCREGAAMIGGKTEGDHSFSWVFISSTRSSEVCQMNSKLE